MKVLIATGGSAGHIFPALAAAREFRTQGHDVALAGVFRDLNEYVRKENFEFTELSARGLNTRSLISAAISSIYMLKSLRESGIILKQISPDAVLGFGGYGAFPVVSTAVFSGIPTMIHEQNVRPGRANRLLSGWVSKIAISFDDSRPHFPKQKTVDTGYPVYRLDASVLTKAEAAAVFGLPSDRFTILVLGGSQGSQFINQCFLKTLTELKAKFPVGVIHISGHKDYPDVANAHRDQGYPFYVMPFGDNMAAAYQAADLVIARSGAGTVTEIAAFGLNAILIPYPHAQAHQRDNAQVLVRSERACMIEQKDLTVEGLTLAIETMARQIRNSTKPVRRADPIFVPDAASRIVSETVKLIKS